jgi:hypothetical protein
MVWIPEWGSLCMILPSVASLFFVSVTPSMGILFPILRIFVIPDEFADCSFKFFEELSWNLDGDCIKSVDCYWQYSHFYSVDLANP